MKRRFRELQKLASWWYRPGGFSIEELIPYKRSTRPVLARRSRFVAPDFSCFDRAAILTSPGLQAGHVLLLGPRRCRNKQPWKSVPQMTGFWRKLLDEPGRPATFPPGSAVSRERNILSKQAHQYARLLRLTSGAGCSLIRHAAERDPPAQQAALAHLSALFSACTACTRPSSILPPVVARHLASPTSGREGGSSGSAP